MGLVQEEDNAVVGLIQKYFYLVEQGRILEEHRGGWVVCCRA